MRKQLLTGGAFRSRLFTELLQPEAGPPSLEPDTRVGAWRVERLIARGGMSEVYLAHRDAEDFEQTVALKLIAADGEASEFVRSERRILGKLRHPAIATLIDGGELESGRVWFAMEYVDGEPIDAYVEARALDWRARLALVARLCDAVGHAHAHLLVHRDIKPSNVLVDAGGHPKLIDFGIAIASRGSDQAGRWLTPGYAAPEQLSGDPITTATDIFQLGRLLETLMLGAGAAPLPHPLVRADLDRIVARATQREPEARYGSAAELAADLGALQQHRPLPGQATARGHGLRLWRLRHPWAPWLALPLLLIVLASAILAQRSAAREAEEMAMALREEQVSTALGAFFVDLFDEPVASEAADGGISALLDRGQRRLLTRPDPAPEVQAALLHGLAQANARMERRAMAIELYEEAARLQRRERLVLPLAQTLAALAWMHGVGGDTARGEQLATEAAGLLTQDLRPGRDRYLALTALGQYHGDTFGFARATELLDQAVRVGRARYGSDSPELYRAQRLQATNLQNQWRVAEALPLTAELSRRCQRDFGADDARCIADDTHWQRMRALAGQTVEARAALGRLWQQRDGWEGSQRHYRSHALRFALADIDWIEGDYGAARRELLASFCDLSQAQGESGPHWISDRGALALLLLDMGAPRAALEVSSEAREAFSGALSGSFEHGFWAVRQAKVEQANGRISTDTEAAVRAAVPRMRETYGDRSYFAARAEHALALIEAERGNAAQALALIETAAMSEAQGLTYFHPQLLADLDALRARLSPAPADASRYQSQALSRLQQTFGNEHPLTAMAAVRRARAQHTAGETMDVAEVGRAMALLTSRQVADSPHLAEARALLGAEASALGVSAAAPLVLDPVACD